MSFKSLLKSSAVAMFCATTTFTVIAPQPAAAHHGVNGQFDLSQTLEVSGVVTSVRFVNPHSYVYFDVTNQAGEIENWRCELRSGSLLKRKGWKTEMFAEGSEITIFGSPARDEPTTCYTETVTFSDGGKLFRYGEVADDGTLVNSESAIAAAANIQEASATTDEGAMAQPDLSGDWGEPAADGPPAAYAGPGPEYQLTEKAVEVGGNWTGEDNPRFNCQATNIILDYRFDQMVNRIEQTADTVTIAYGFMDVARTIHIDGTFPEAIEPSLEGYSVGVWNGDRLEVTTKGFAVGFLEVIGGRSTSSIPHSEEMEIVEIFYIDDAGELVREYTITDPVYLAQPYSHLDKSVRLDGEYLPFGCDDLTEEAEYQSGN
ncbi:DUF6152 family protein [Yoonia sp. MH D7]